MNKKTFEKITRDMFENRCMRLMLGSKDDEYSRNDDKLHNFKRVGVRRNTPPEEALMGMLEKHLVSIEDMIDDIVHAYRCNNSYVPNFDTWSEKLGDAINYLFLLYALIYERYNPSEYMSETIDEKRREPNLD